MDFDQILEQNINNNDGDISKVYHELQEQFNVVQSNSVALFNEERDLRQLLAFYQRRNNGILDMLAETEEVRDIDDAELEARIDNLVELNRNLSSLRQIKSVIDGDSSINLKLLLLLQESIPELEIDDCIKIQKNPQDIEMWLRRNYSELVPSKFKPISFKDNHLVVDGGVDLNGKKRKKT